MYLYYVRIIIPYNMNLHKPIIIFWVIQYFITDVKFSKRKKSKTKRKNCEEENNGKFIAEKESRIIFYHPIADDEKKKQCKKTGRDTFNKNN
jgi:hypothetical protein